MVIGGNVLGCGNCIPCRSRRAKIWGNRIALEMSSHAENVFITLTYNNESIPAEGSLNRKHALAFIKRLRRRTEYHFGIRFRYFLCGEYGNRTGRAHYHAVLFGLGTWCSSMVTEAWPHGFVSVLPADKGSGPYVAGYMVKKLGKLDRLPCEPEFITMSTKPGLGSAVADALVPLCQDGIGLDEYGDVPTYILAGKFKIALGSYLRRRIRRALYEREGIPLSKARDYYDQVLKVYEAAAENGQKASFSHPVKAVQMEQKFLRSRRNETF